MANIDYLVFFVYSLFIVGLGVYFFFKTKNNASYFTGDKELGAGHIGLSVVATDVGGGFSIGLGGLGFTLGLSGSWLLFTGLLGAWLSAVLVIPAVFKTKGFDNLSTFPGFLGAHYGASIALVAALFSGIGYIGFTSAQLLAGVKLAAGTFPDVQPHWILIGMGLAAVLYTAFGGMKAVIYTDTIQWIVLILGLGGIGIPLGYMKVGGWKGLQSTLPESFFSLNALTSLQVLEWSFTILPIWFVGMTLYQRIFACRDVKTARKAWFIAGLFEYPIMAFLGVGVGMLARSGAELGMMSSLGFSSAAEVVDPEVAIPMFIVSILPSGLVGLLLAAYFSAIMSTADSCLMAASGNISVDILKFKNSSIHRSQLVTLLIGLLSIAIAWKAEKVLAIMLSSYSVMVSAMVLPVLSIVFKWRFHATSILISMLVGGGTALAMELFGGGGAWVVPISLSTALSSAWLSRWMINTSS